ncbi:MAG: discoidin domain-containing protein [Clostridia bacterium]|nr:discoidin domain-containing protein [Clostridia bacterium]
MNYNNNNSPYTQNNSGYQPQNGNYPPQQGMPNQQYNPQFNPQFNAPVQMPPKKKNTLGIVIAVFLVVALVIAGSVIGISLTNSANSPKKIIEALEAGKYGEAMEIYEDKYGIGATNTELTDALLERLFEIEAEFEMGKISQNRALKELETIGEMTIFDIEDDIQNTIAFVKGEETVDSETEESDNSTDTENDNSDDDEADNKSNVTPPHDSDLKSEPIPEGAPIITDAVTLSGDVLASSNTNSARSFGAEKTIDGYYDSCWCVNTDNLGGVGASVRFYLNGKSVVNGVRIVNGNLYRPYEDIYKSNGQIERFVLTFSDGTSKTFTASYNGTANAEFQTFEFDEPVVTEYITLTVQSGYQGEKYSTNVCLGEFSVY